MSSLPATEPAVDPHELRDGLAEARARTLELVAPFSNAELERVFSPLMSPLAWDLGHIAAYEDLWLVHRFGGEPMERADLAEVYDAFETPRAGRGDLPFLGPGEARAYGERVRERALGLLERRGPGDGRLHEMVIRHEHQHNETMLQTIGLARIDRAPRRAVTPPAAGAEHTGLDLVDVPAGPFERGAPAAGFAYDNERPRETVEVGGFRIGRTPVTNGAFEAFVAQGGYEREELWSAAGWRWRCREQVQRPAQWGDDGREWRIGAAWRARSPGEPVSHVSWFEAEAFARAHGARLPTEMEWEKAATWDPARGETRAYPWGDAPPRAGDARANLDQLCFGPAPAGAYPAGASPCGALGMLGDVWEWTASPFQGYPGFVAHPYREYSEVFFDGDFRVLRGGSWATRARVATPTFRNWDHPQRRQIFSGFRIARDA